MNQTQGENTKRAKGRGFFSLDLTPTLLCFPTAMVATYTLVFMLFLEYVFPLLAAWWPELELVYHNWPLSPLFSVFQYFFAGGAVLLLFVSLVGLIVQRRWTLWTIRKGYVVVYLMLAMYAFFTLKMSGEVASAVRAEEPKNDFVLSLFYFRVQWLWPAGCVALLTIYQHILSWRRATYNIYARQRESEPMAGDRVVENIRTHGRDPSHRKSSYGGSFVHLLIIIIIPLLLTFRGGCIRPYRVPAGSGNPTVAMVKVIKKKKKKKRKKYILSKNAAIVMELPDLDESELEEEVNEQTKQTYVADTSAAHGKMGTGGGNQAGWADGFGDGEIRFIRLEYNGPDWDDGMDESDGADANFLAAFRKIGGFDAKQVADDGESHPISSLKKYPKGQAPPFVYMTGSRHISLSKTETETLRTYIKEGGMIFADAGSHHWHRSFMGVANSLLPGSPLRPISEDDPIFQIPFSFPNGPPPLFHHGGNQSLGVKYKGRWAVFYFPGDMNDAWKTGHSGVKPHLAEEAMHLGVNVVYYATTHYLEATRKHRK